MCGLYLYHAIIRLFHHHHCPAGSRNGYGTCKAHQNSYIDYPRHCSTATMLFKECGPQFQDSAGGKGPGKQMDLGLVHTYCLETLMSFQLIDYKPA